MAKKTTSIRSAVNPLFNKELGQHILKSPLVAQAIVHKAQLTASDIVLEVGPGTGNLTVRILPLVKKVVAVERDTRLAAELIKRLQPTPDLLSKLQLIVGDVVDLEPLPYFDVCISNTPYQISSPLTFKLLYHRPQFRCAVLMFQREFALRLTARSGDGVYCRLSVNAQLMSKIAHVMKVSRNSFRPPPQVESSVVRITPRPIGDFGHLHLRDWDGMLRTCFMRKNKTLAANFRSGDLVSVVRRNAELNHALQWTDDHVKDLMSRVLEETGLSSKRASKMTQEDFLALHSALTAQNLHFEGAFGGAVGSSHRMHIDDSIP
jgi:18S rRNA (adenine1779-N6/adenine1780-N6)-dimethyltransferase